MNHSCTVGEDELNSGQGCSWERAPSVGWLPCTYLSRSAAMLIMQQALEHRH